MRDRGTVTTLFRGLLWWVEKQGCEGQTFSVFNGTHWKKLKSSDNLSFYSAQLHVYKSIGKYFCCVSSAA